MCCTCEQKWEDIKANWYIIIAFLILVISVFLALFFQGKFPGWTIIVAAIGIVFSVLKYKLDRANYHKDLFEKRFEIYSIANEAHWYWASHKEINNDIEKKISNDFMGKAYYLFDIKTYEFISSLRADLKKFHNDKSLSSEEKITANKRLGYWVDHPEEFRDQFRNLGIRFY